MDKFKTGTITEKGIVVLPVKLRRKMQIGEGDKLEFEFIDENTVIVRPIKTYDIFEVVGLLKSEKPLVDVSDIRDQVRKDVISDDLRRQE